MCEFILFPLRESVSLQLTEMEEAERKKCSQGQPYLSEGLEMTFGDLQGRTTSLKKTGDHKK